MSDLTSVVVSLTPECVLCRRCLSTQLLTSKSCRWSENGGSEATDLNLILGYLLSFESLWT